MNINLEEVNTVKRKLTVEVPAADVAIETGKILADLAKSAKVKGFRPGKAPRSVIKNVYQMQINQQLTESVISNSLPKAIKEKQLSPIDTPQLEEIDWNGEETTVFKFTVSFEVKPVFDITGWDSLKASKIKVEIKPDDIDRHLEELRTNMAQTKTVEDPDRILAEKDDIATLDFQGYKDGEALEKLKGEKVSVEMGAGRFLPDFESGLVGLKIEEEKELTVIFPQDYHEEELKGQEVIFKAKLLEIKERIKPELDDEFVKDFALEGITNLTEFKEKIKTDLIKRAEDKVESDFDNQIHQLLSDLVEFEVPEVLINLEINAMLEQFKMRLKQNNLTITQVGLKESDLIKDYQEKAQKNVKVALIVDQIITEENIEISEEEIEEELLKLAEQFGRDLASMKAIYTQADFKERFLHQLKVTKAIKRTKEKAEIEIKA